MAIGEVFAVIAAALTICGSAWALLVISSIVFGAKTLGAQTALERKPWQTLTIGLPTVAFFGFLAVILAAQPIPLVKLAGTALYLAILAIAALGGGGLATLIGRKMLPLDSSLSPFQALSRGSGILVLASLFPLLGWFLIAPMVLVMSFGAGVQALVAKPSSPPVMSEVR